MLKEIAVGSFKRLQKALNDYGEFSLGEFMRYFKFTIDFNVKSSITFSFSDVGAIFFWLEYL